MIACVSLGSGQTAGGHDSWLVADADRVDKGQPVLFSFISGEIFPFGEAVTDPDRVHRFEALEGSTTRDLNGFEEGERALVVSAAFEDSGLHVVGCALEPRLIELEPQVFRTYLQSERADAALKAWEATGAADVATERYTKFAKTIVEVASASDDDATYQSPLGHRLEIIPLSNPRRWRSGDAVGVRVLLDGYPWPGVAVSVGREGLNEHGYVHTTRTDAAGEATLMPDRPGHWFIKAHLIRPTSGLGRVAWESFWATLTFRVAGEPSTAGDNRTEVLEAVRRVHGAVAPWPVVGYRMGRRAVADLRPAAGALSVVHLSPMESGLAAIADGIQAATDVTVGKLTLRVEYAPKEEMQTVFIDTGAGRRAVFKLSPALMERLQSVARHEREDAARMVAALRDDDLFEVAIDTLSGVQAPRKPSTP